MSPHQYVSLWVAITSVSTFLVFAWDKRASKRDGRRVPERNLLAWSVFGGAPGALIAMAVLRHKIRKPGFWIAEVGATSLWAWGWWNV